MTTNRKTSRSTRKQAKRALTATRGGSGAQPVSEAGTVHRVTPTSERIIKETSVKRRKAMEALANR